MINRTVFGCRSNGGAKAWRDHATGAVQSRGSLRTFSKGQILSVDAIRGHEMSHEPCPQSSTITASGPFRSSPEIQPGNQYT